MATRSREIDVVDDVRDARVVLRVHHPLYSDATVPEAQRAIRLSQITLALADAVGPDDVVGAVVDDLSQILGAETAGLWLVPEPGQAASLRRSAGPDVRANEPAALECIARGEPIWPTSCVACLPLVVSGTTLGALVLTFESAVLVDDDERVFLQLVARFTGQALERLRLLETETARAARAVVLAASEQAHRLRVELLHRMAAGTNRAVHLEEVFELALDAIGELGAERGSILAFDDAGVMRFRAWRGLSDSYRAAVEGHSPWDRAASSFAPIVVRDVHADPRWAAYAEVFRAESIAALAFIPLVNAGALVGKFMLYWSAPRDVDELELETASAIASHAAASLVRFGMVDALQQAVHFNKLFTGILGHDLRNPLTAMMTAAQVARSRGGDVVERPVSRILSSGGRMARMIDQLLDFTRVRLGSGIPVRPASGDLATLLRRILDEHTDERLQLVHDGVTTGSWDEDRLGQVFSNLIGNALHHGAAGEPVCVSLHGDDDGVRVEVKNGGVIAAELLPRLFEPLGGSTERRNGSSGLGHGHYISRQIVQGHRGTISVTSDDVGGTRFNIWLPRT
ncbi:MAG: GAF domain-containing protein [Deltaproteobacteria bacterium]|nr:GAF domain-containing protein [Deltaproteobacteria bacterium]